MPPHERPAPRNRRHPHAGAHVGLNVDAWYHLHFGFEIETFFTWPHALIYGGWLALGMVKRAPSMWAE